jgi:hypothetical protein
MLGRTDAQSVLMSIVMNHGIVESQFHAGNFWAILQTRAIFGQSCRTS